MSSTTITHRVAFSQSRNVLPAAVARRSPARRQVAMRDAVSVKLSANDDLSPAIAVAVFAAVKQGAIMAGTEQLRVGIAVAALALPICNLLTRKGHLNWVSSCLSPAVLAAEVLKVATIGAAAIVAFGSMVCTTLEEKIDIKGAYYVLMATLVAAVYKEYGAVWFCTAVAVDAGWQFVKGAQDKKVLVLPALIFGLVAYALVEFGRKSSTVLAGEVTVCIIAATILWSIYNTGKAFADDLTSS